MMVARSVWTTSHHHQKFSRCPVVMFFMGFASLGGSRITTPALFVDGSSVRACLPRMAAKSIRRSQDSPVLSLRAL
ncbi:hypothetical protein Tsubulata_016331 [Turnera subulata]|uniref:Uncharacterized protein n=1 Tax=Turnera subulata TaxID=218843 RepID=A0A9Q0G4Q7_9ROSI|nr:hypothetical protein Tsubulata_016331 [Turnera subulata]